MGDSADTMATKNTVASLSSTLVEDLRKHLAIVGKARKVQHTLDESIQKKINARVKRARDLGLTFNDSEQRIINYLSPTQRAEHERQDLAVKKHVARLMRTNTERTVASGISYCVKPPE